MKCKIRYATEKDVAVLSDLGTITFYDAFSENNTEENMVSHVENTYSPQQIKTNLRSENIVYFLAEKDNEAVGFAKLGINNQPNTLQNHDAIELHQLYVLQTAIGKGIGAALMQACVDEAKKQNVSGIWLGVWERNPKAIAFYKKWGFAVTAFHEFVLGDEIQTDLIMELEIKQ